MKYNIKTAINFLKMQKEQFAKSPNSKELPPHVIVESQDGPEAIVISPSLNKDLAIKAAYLCNIGFQPSSMTIAFDALMSKVENQDEKQDCIVCHNIDKEGEMKMSVLPYTSVDDKVFWIDEEQNFDPSLDETEAIQGDIPDALVQVMKSTPSNLMQEIANDLGSECLSTEEAKFQVGRIIISILIGMGFKIVDLFSYKHPHWTEARQKGISIVKDLVSQKKVNPEYEAKLLETVTSHIGKPSFIEKMEHHLTLAGLNCPEGLSNIEFVQKFQQTCMQPKAIDHEVAKKIFTRFDV